MSQKAAAGKKAIKAQATYKAGPYKGYSGHAEWDADEGIFHGNVIGTRDVITFQGKTVDELGREFCESVEDYLEMCKESGRPPERPFSGNFVVRISPGLHKRMSNLAEQRGESLNTLVVKALEKFARTAGGEMETDLAGDAPPKGSTPRPRARKRA